MRKKLLALLMCATMVLGTGVTAFAAPSADDYDNAKKVIEQFGANKGNVTGEYDAKKEVVTFTTEYVIKAADNSAYKSIQYKYAFTGSGENSYTKVNDDNEMYYKLRSSNDHFDADIDTAKHKIYNVTNGTAAGRSVAKIDNKLYYVTENEAKTGDTVKEGDYLVNASATLGSVLSAGTKYYNLQQFDGDVTGKVLVDNTAIPVGFVNDYGIDPDGYINITGSKVSYKLSSKVADGYWVGLYQAADTYKTDIANALADGTISPKAVAVDVEVFETTGNDSKRHDNGTTTGSYSMIEYGFQKLVNITADKASHDITFKTDWLSQSNAKNANTVFLLDRDVKAYTDYFTKIGSIYKVSDLADEKFSTQYVVSGVYIFDYVENASEPDTTPATTPSSNNDGVADTTANTSKSPTTGDAAPIAALAVVMMGACGAMVVASKKRA